MRTGASRTYFADLHCHSVFSDGVLSPELLVRAAAECGVKVLALTDHDSVDGIGAFRTATLATDLRPVVGIEISASIKELRGREVHVLGYGFDQKNARIVEYCVSRREARAARVRAICARLATMGYSVDCDAIVAEAKGQVGRPHVARALVAAGHVRSVEDAFRKWLGDGRPAFIDYGRIDAADAIAMIRDAGGLSSLAHPGLTKIDDRLEDLARAGLGAIEAFHPDHSAATAARYARLAKGVGLRITGGSDFHGDERHARRALGGTGLDRETFGELGVISP